MKPSRWVLALPLVAFLFALPACGVTKQEHDKVVAELNEAKKAKADLEARVNQLEQEKTGLANSNSQLQSQVANLQSQLEAAKAPAKPAAKAKAPAKKK